MGAIPQRQYDTVNSECAVIAGMTRSYRTRTTPPVGAPHGRDSHPRFDHQSHTSSRCIDAFGYILDAQGSDEAGLKQQYIGLYFRKSDAAALAGDGHEFVQHHR
jgi:hypothetical protein